MQIQNRIKTFSFIAPIYSKVIFTLSMTVLFTALLSSCEEVKSQAAAKPKKNPPNTVLQTPACYLSTCLDTLPVSNIIDPANDYAYPDPNNYLNPILRPQYSAPIAVLDLQKFDPNQHLSPNFLLKEVMSASKGRYALYSSDVISTLQYIRNSIGLPLHINSGYRSPGYNGNVDGSAKWSRHTYGDGVDFYITGLKISDLTAICEKFGASFSLTYSKHIHCDWRKNKLDPAFYSLSKSFSESILPSISQQLTQESHLIVQQNSQVRQLSVQLPHEIAEEGSPTYLWSIRTPTGEVLTSLDTEINLVKASGTFEVDVVVGGSIHIHKIFIW